MVYESGDVFEGDWVDDQRSGLGVLSHGTMSVCYLFPLTNFSIFFQANGDRYEGHWLDDKKEGPGMAYVIVFFCFRCSFLCFCILLYFLCSFLQLFK